MAARRVVPSAVRAIRQPGMPPTTAMLISQRRRSACRGKRSSPLSARTLQIRTPTSGPDDFRLAHIQGKAPHTSWRELTEDGETTVVAALNALLGGSCGVVAR